MRAGCDFVIPVPRNQVAGEVEARCRDRTTSYESALDHLTTERKRWMVNADGARARPRRPRSVDVFAIATASLGEIVEDLVEVFRLTRRPRRRGLPRA